MAIRRCKVCGGWYSESFFWRKGRDAHGRTRRNATCTGCEQTRKDTFKATPEGRAQKKADWAVYYRARRLGKTVKELRTVYGWDSKRMARDILRTYAKGCPCCQRSIAEMGYGLLSVSQHIVDPAAPPYYEANVQWVCQACNGIMQGMMPEEKVDFWEYCKSTAGTPN